MLTGQSKALNHRAWMTLSRNTTGEIRAEMVDPDGRIIIVGGEIPCKDIKWKRVVICFHRGLTRIVLIR
jgi:hypothetical protein